MSLIIPELPEQYWQHAMTLLTKAYPQSSAHVVEAAAGRVYIRKGHDTVRELHAPPTRDYESSEDDVVITVTVRLNWREAQEIGIATMTEAMRDEQLQVLYAERDQAQASLSAVNDRIAAVLGENEWP